MAPPEGTVERWAWDYLHTTDLAYKLTPPPAPERYELDAPARRVLAPSRPRGLTVVERAEKIPSAGALRDPLQRARLMHTFLHHELQAAELMAWALLAFPEAPTPFRRGLITVFADEVRHMALYAEHLERHGARFGQWSVRDWFWQRVPVAPTAAHFVAAMGMGFEGANLDHCARFAAQLRAVGDLDGARRVEAVGEEELPHVRFGLHWFRRFTGGDDFSSWSAHLPEPLSPWLMKGPTFERATRLRAGFSEGFLDALEAVQWSPRRSAPGT
jgi:uncharacterized ferritin-like protein (DUF455 family)